MFNKIKPNKAPKLTIEVIKSREQNSEIGVIIIPTNTVATTGLCVFLLTYDSCFGNTQSRPIAKSTLVTATCEACVVAIPKEIINVIVVKILSHVPPTKVTTSVKAVSGFKS